jgi:hypothetical protein
MLRQSGVSTVGSVRTYDGRDEAAFGNFTMIAAGRREAGRFFWTRFEPADLSRDSDQQEQYQRLAINALSYVSQAPGVSVANWPEGRAMALSVVAISAPGYDPLTWYSSVERFMSFAASRHLHVSYFLPSREMVAFRPMYARMVDSGAEIGISSVDDRLMTGEEVETQIERLSRAASELGLTGVHGVYPPGGFVTAATIRALDRVAADYVLEPRRGVYAPGTLDWWDYAAWNDDFVSDAESESSTSSSARLPSIGVVPMSDPVEDVPLSDFARARRAGGAFVMPVYPELFDARAERNLSDVLQAAEAAGAWGFTASELYRWWRARATLRPEIVLQGPHVIEVEVEKATADTLRGVALDVSLPGMPVERMRADQGVRLIHADAASETVRIVLSPLIDRRTRISLAWDD